MTNQHASRNEAQGGLKQFLNVRAKRVGPQTKAAKANTSSTKLKHIEKQLKKGGDVVLPSSATLKASREDKTKELIKGVRNNEDGGRTSVGRVITPKKVSVPVSPLKRSHTKEVSAHTGTKEERNLCTGASRNNDAISAKASSPAKSTRRRLFDAPQPHTSGHEDPIAVAVAEEKKKFRSSKRDKFAHLLARRQTTLQPSAPEASTSSAVEEPRDRRPSRFRYLLNKNKQSLKLPYHYQVLLAKFLALETVCMIQGHCRGKTVTFDTARPSVERTCCKKFTDEDLAQIMTVFPEAYELDLIHRNGRSPEGIRGTIGGYHSGVSSIRISVDFGTNQEVDARMNERKEIFTANLLVITKAAHQQFLKKLSLPIECEDEDVQNWHPDFKLDNVPHIKRAKLPEPQGVHIPSATEILGRQTSMSATVKRALEHVVAKQSVPRSPIKKRKVEETGGGVAAPSAEPTEPAKPSASMTLLEKIRLKERLTKEHKIREASVAGNASALQKMWECATIVRACALSRQKNALTLRDCIIAVKRTIKVPMSEVMIKDLFIELTKTVPAWCRMKKIQDKSYFLMVPSQFGVVQNHFRGKLN